MVAIDIAEPVSQEADAKVTRVRLDLADSDATAAASSEIIETFGSVDILVDNAGILSNNKILRHVS